MKSNLKQREKRIKAWAIICSKRTGTRAFSIKQNAENHLSFLDLYSGVCEHKLVPCTIILNPKNK